MARALPMLRVSPPSPTGFCYSRDFHNLESGLLAVRLFLRANAGRLWAAIGIGFIAIISPRKTLKHKARIWGKRNR